MGSVEQRARDWIAESVGPLKLDRITPEEAWRIAYEAGFAAALREQPEARGVVDGLSWEMRQRVKHAGVVTGELLNKAADALDTLTAAQQPAQAAPGWKLVPVEPTEKMFDAGFEAASKQYSIDPLFDNVAKVYAIYGVMLAVCHTAPVQDPPGDADGR